MDNNYTQFDWAADRLSRSRWADEEERMMERIDRRIRKEKKLNKRNHRNYA